MENINKKLSKGFTLIEMIVVMAVFLFIIGAAISVFLSVVDHQRKVLAEEELLSQVSYVQEHMSKALRTAKDEGSEGCLLDTQGNELSEYIYLLTRPDINCGQNDPECGFYTGIKFVNALSQSSADGDTCQEFYLAPASAADTRLVLWESTDGGATSTPLTSPDLQINYAKFSIDGTDGSTADSPDTIGSFAGATITDPTQPKVTISLSVTTPADDLNNGAACNINSDCATGIGNVCDVSDHLCALSRIVQTTVSNRNLNVK